MELGRSLVAIVGGLLCLTIWLVGTARRLGSWRSVADETVASLRRPACFVLTLLATGAVVSVVMLALMPVSVSSVIDGSTAIVVDPPNDAKVGIPRELTSRYQRPHPG